MTEDNKEEAQENINKEEPKKDTIKFEFNKKIIWEVIALLLLIALIITTIQLNKEQPVPTPTGPQPSGPIEISADDDPVLGDVNTPITIIEFSDFQCPFCGRFFAETLPLIKQNYVDTGKAKFVYRDFPLSSIHPEATPAAEAAECADEQGKFWEFHNGLFENQASLSTALYQNLAEKYGLDIGQFEQCIGTRKYQSEVQADFSYGSGLGITGTPTVFINGKMIVGAQPYQAFQQAIETELQ